MHVLLCRRLTSLACWFLVAYVGAVGAAASNSSAIVEVDLTFPRNETYAPSPLLPVVFAFQNAKLASSLNARILFDIWDYNNRSESSVSATYSLRWANFSSSDPYFEYRGFSYKFNTEGIWMLTWRLGWDSCTEESLDLVGNHRLVANYSGDTIIFTTKKSSQEVDLVAVSNNQTCSESAGVTVNITNTLKVPAWVDWDGGETCAVVASSTSTPDPCRVKIDAVAASSISSSITSRACLATDPPVACPADDENAAQRVAVVSVACLAAGFGVLGYILW